MADNTDFKVAVTVISFISVISLSFIFSSTFSSLLVFPKVLFDNSELGIRVSQDTNPDRTEIISLEENSSANN